jgi:nucleoside-diphosphate-sugar epimerase
MNTLGAKLIFGCGYVGHRVAEAWRDQGHPVAIVTRSSDRAKLFNAEGFRAITADIMLRETLYELPEAQSVLFAVGYDRSQPWSIGDVYARGLRNALNALPAGTGRIMYLSSTGVYGDSGGAWIDEATVAEPTREGGKACLAAEHALFAHPLGARGIVLRLAGIYGPGRVPRRDDVLAGKPIAGNGDGYLNLIHVHDVVHAVLAAEARASLGRTFNLADGHPVRRADYYTELARLYGAPTPQFTGVMGPGRIRGGADKRVGNARMLAELAVKLQFPTYREGLAAIVREF